MKKLSWLLVPTLLNCSLSIAEPAVATSPSSAVVHEGEANYTDEEFKALQALRGRGVDPKAACGNSVREVLKCEMGKEENWRECIHEASKKFEKSFPAKSDKSKASANAVDCPACATGLAEMKKGGNSCIRCHAVGVQIMFDSSDVLDLNFRKTHEEYFDRRILKPLPPGGGAVREADETIKLKGFNKFDEETLRKLHESQMRNKKKEGSSIPK